MHVTKFDGLTWPDPHQSDKYEKNVLSLGIYKYVKIKYKLGVKIIAPFFKWLYNKDDSIFCIYLF